MQFCDKLDFLMKISNTANKELAHGSAVYRSLISLRRTGRRPRPAPAPPSGSSSKSHAASHMTSYGRMGRPAQHIPVLLYDRKEPVSTWKFSNL